MLALQKQPRYFSKLVTMPDGTQALVVFELIERNGHLIAKAVYAETVEASSIPEQKVCALPGERICETVRPVLSFVPGAEFISFSDFSFVMSQRTRAPSLF